MHRLSNRIKRNRVSRSEADRLYPRTIGNMRGPRAACRSPRFLRSDRGCGRALVEHLRPRRGPKTEMKNRGRSDGAAARERRRSTAGIPLAR